MGRGRVASRARGTQAYVFLFCHCQHLASTPSLVTLWSKIVIRTPGIKSPFQVADGNPSLFRILCRNASSFCCIVLSRT